MVWARKVSLRLLSAHWKILFCTLVDGGLERWLYVWEEYVSFDLMFVSFTHGLLDTMAWMLTSMEENTVGLFHTYRLLCLTFDWKMMTLWADALIVSSLFIEWTVDLMHVSLGMSTNTLFRYEHIRTATPVPGTAKSQSSMTLHDADTPQCKQIAYC